MLTWLTPVATVAGMACWTVCFFWMHRISKRQDAVLEHLKKQATRIENVAREEHKILQDVHPTVQKIERNLDENTPAKEKTV